jgi:cation transport protein ChaC
MNANDSPPPFQDWPPDAPAPGWLTDKERAESLASVMADRGTGAPIWVFAYGSLLWKPAFHAVERRLGAIKGYHRRFCLIMRRFRATDEVPGLMMALDRGGQCRGMAFRLDPVTAMDDLAGLWRREMVTGAYIPRWIEMRGENEPIRAIAFTANRAHERYRRPESDEAAARMIAVARGPVGTNAEYLFETHAHLLSLGIRDRGLDRLERLVRERVGNGG